MVRTLETNRMIEAEPEDVGLSSSKLENVSRIAQRYVDERKIPGAITAVARHGRVVHFETFGSMNDEAGQAMRADAILRFYSMTKPIASVGLMTLYEEGMFQLDDPVSRYIPEFKGLKVLASGTAESYTTREPAREMTIRDLLMHTSGLTASGPGSPVAQLYQRAGANRNTGGVSTVAEMAARLGTLPLKCDPGAEWNYGISTDMVGYLCEILSGQPLDRFLSERILEPLGMVDTGFQVPQASLDRFAANYRYVPGVAPSYELIDEPANSPYARNVTYFSGAGGLVSTAADYLRFCKMLANGGSLDGAQILGPRTLRLMTLNHLPGGVDIAAMNADGPTETARDGVGFGLGFAVHLDTAKAQTQGVPGEYYWGGAASTAFFISPAEDLIALFLTQLMPSSSYPVRRQLRAAVYGSIID